MRRMELPNNTDEQVREYVVKAIDLADEFADRDASVWRAIFRAAYDGFAGKQALLEQPAPVDRIGLPAGAARAGAGPQDAGD